MTQLPQLLANDGVLSQSVSKKNGSHVKRKTDEELLAGENSELESGGENGESAQEPLQLAQAEITGAAAAATADTAVAAGATTAVAADAAVAAGATTASSAGGIGAILSSAGVGTGTAIAGAAAMGLGVGIVATDSEDTPNNAAPVAVSDTFTTGEDTPLNIAAAALLGNDRDAEGNSLSLTSVTNGTGGTVVLNADGTITFTPAANFNGTATFDYTITDGTGSSSAAVQVNVTALNDAPRNTVPGLQTVAEDTNLTINGISVLDADGSNVTVILSANNGLLTLSGITGLSFTQGSGTTDTSMTFSGTQANINNALNGLVYRANPDYNGANITTDTVTVTTSDDNSAIADSTIAVNVTPVNDAPVAADNSLSDVVEDSGVRNISIASLLANDVDGDAEIAQTLTITSLANVVGGTAVVNGSNIDFTPTADFNGTASFDYTVQDNGTTGSNATPAPLIDTGRVSFTVTPLNEAPRLVANALTISEGGTVTMGAANFANVDADTAGDLLVYTFTVSAVTNGNFVLASNPAVPIFSFTAEQVRAGSIQFIHNGGEAAPSFNTLVTGTDNGFAIPGAPTIPAPATINFTNVNDAPVAVNDTTLTALAATEDTVATYTAAQLLGNDTDVDNTNNQLSISTVTSGIGGTAVLNANGTVTFTPTANFNGAASFSYVTSDGAATSSGTIVTVNVAAVNDAPLAIADTTLVATEDTVATYNVTQLTGNDTDVENNPLTIASVASITGGTVLLNANGTVTFTPTANFSGAASFSYTASDGQGANATSNSATVTVNVAAVNDAPVATADTLTATEDTAITYTAAQLTGNDTDADSNPLTLTGVASGSGGTVLLNANGTVTFTPNANFSGAASFSYVVSDGQGTTSSSTPVTVNVAAVNDVPLATADTLAAIEDTAVTYTAAQLTDNDTDADGNPLTIAGVTSGSNGAVVLNANGTVTFTPTANFSGAASFSYTASDGQGTSNSATVTVNVAAVNDAPLANANTLDATEDTAIIYTASQLTGNDTDVENNLLTIASVASGIGGTVLLNANGTVTFT
ncbi:MAG: tandem-95 repeat protein, partial [Candidatus Nitrotoga sp.]